LIQAHVSVTQQPPHLVRDVLLIAILVNSWVTCILQQLGQERTRLNAWNVISMLFPWKDGNTNNVKMKFQKTGKLPWISF